MKFHELKNNIDKWAEEKGIHDKGSCFSQLSKTHEEVLELVTAINNSDFDETKDAIGDILVTLINASWFVPNYDIVTTYYKIKHIEKINGDKFKPIDFYKNIDRIFYSLGKLFSNILRLSDQPDSNKKFTNIFKNEVNHIITSLNNMVNSDRMLGLTLENCLESTYEVISKRNGKMDPNTGVFVKESNEEFSKK